MVQGETRGREGQPRTASCPRRRQAARITFPARPKPPPDALAHHHRRHVRVGPRAIWQDRSIDDAQPLKPVDLAVLILTTANGSDAGPILQVPHVCWPVVMSRAMNASSRLSSAALPRRSARCAFSRCHGKPGAPAGGQPGGSSRACADGQTRLPGIGSRGAACALGSVD